MLPCNKSCLVLFLIVLCVCFYLREMEWWDNSLQLLIERIIIISHTKPNSDIPSLPPYVHECHRDAQLQEYTTNFEMERRQYTVGKVGLAGECEDCSKKLISVNQALSVCKASADKVALPSPFATSPSNWGASWESNKTGTFHYRTRFDQLRMFCSSPHYMSISYHVK